MVVENGAVLLELQFEKKQRERTAQNEEESQNSPGRARRAHRAMTTGRTTKRSTAVFMLLAISLIASAQGVSSEHKQLQQQESDQETIDATVDARFSAAVSGCGLCQRSGQCDEAFRGSPGQFCQTLVSGAPCCCPQDSQCVLNNVYNCRCRRTVASSTKPNVRVVSHTSTTSSESPKWSTLFFLLIMLCCVCCCCCASKQSQDRRDYYAQPVYTPTQYGTAPQNDKAGGYPGLQAQQPAYGYAYPSAPPVYEEPDRYDSSRGGGNGLAASAVGAVAGLAAGAFLGSAFSGDGGGSRRETTEYFGGDTGYGGTSESTFEFSGDTGGDDGGDFAGDS